MTKKNFDLEYILHRLTQDHLNEFKLEFVASERELDKKIIKKLDCPKLVLTKKETNKRVDTIAFDCETEELVLIEYKNKYDSNVINQVREYLCYVEKCPKYFAKRFAEGELEEKEFEFKDIRVMIIGPKFDEEQIKNPYGFEIWEVSLDEENKVTYANMNTCEKIEFTTKPEELKMKEEDTEDSLKFEKRKVENWDLYLNFKEKVMTKKDVKPKFWIGYVSFLKNEKIVCQIHLKGRAKIHYLADNLEDFIKKAAALKKEEHETRNIKEIESYVGNYELILNSKEDIDYALELFELIYEEK